MKFNIFYNNAKIYAICIKHLHYINSILDIIMNVIINNLIYIYTIYRHLKYFIDNKWIS